MGHADFQGFTNCPGRALQVFDVSVCASAFAGRAWGFPQSLQRPQQSEVPGGWGLLCAGITRGPTDSIPPGVRVERQSLGPPRPRFSEPEFLACLDVGGRRVADSLLTRSPECLTLPSVSELWDGRRPDSPRWPSYLLWALVSSGPSPPATPKPLKCLKILYNLCHCSCQEAGWLGWNIEVTREAVVIHQCPSVPRHTHSRDGNVPRAWSLLGTVTRVPGRSRLSSSCSTRR